MKENRPPLRGGYLGKPETVRIRSQSVEELGGKLFGTIQKEEKRALLEVQMQRKNASLPFGGERGGPWGGKSRSPLAGKNQASLAGKSTVMESEADKSS